MQYETLIWLAPTLVGVAVFSAVCAVFWPRKTIERVIASWDIHDSDAFDAALESGEPLPWVISGGKPRIG